jgi:DNA-binding FadR family transcriptional regulator
MKLPRIRSARRVDEVAAVLRRAIEEGRVKVGERFPSEREMSAQLGVARLVVREALRSLESAGLVKIKRGVNGGCFVHEATPHDVSKSFSDLLRMARVSLRDLLEVRLGLEAAIVSSAIERATKTDLSKLQENVVQSRALLKNGSSPELRERVDQFHLLLAEATHNPVFLFLTHSILDIVNQYMVALHYTSIISPKTVKEHEIIFGFVSARDRANSIRATLEHIREDNRRLARRAAQQKLEYVYYLPPL